jgi:DNA-binding response OmpR family regulator
MPRALIIEDETKLLRHLEEVMCLEGFSVCTCSTYAEMEEFLNPPVKRIDVILLDRLLQRRDTAEMMPQIKLSFPDTKVVVVSAINTPAEKTALLDLGADDYIAKPFDPDELIARVRAVMRRVPAEPRFGNVILNPDRRTVRVDDLEVPLQNREFLLLNALMKNPGKVFDKAFLLENLWEMSAEVESNVIEATVSKVRKRLEDIGANFTIKSMRNRGYWIEE